MNMFELDTSKDHFIIGSWKTVLHAWAFRIVKPIESRPYYCVNIEQMISPLILAAACRKLSLMFIMRSRGWTGTTKDPFTSLASVNSHHVNDVACNRVIEFNADSMNWCHITPLAIILQFEAEWLVQVLLFPKIPFGLLYFLNFEETHSNNRKGLAT